MPAKRPLPHPVPAAGGSRVYQTLTTQVGGKILAEIQAGKWVDWLPGERILAEQLQVSRKTLRKALLQLQHDGIVTTQHGLGHRIFRRSPAKTARPTERSIGLLSPTPLGHLRPYTALWVDELRSLLFQNGIGLATFSGQRYFSTRPQKTLQRLVRQNPQACWLLVHSNEPMQHWFCDARVPCVVAGTGHAGLPLPNVDWDYFSSCRHAAGTLLRQGHRRLVFLTQHSQRAGDLESEAGFIAGVRHSTHGDANGTVLRHNGTVADVRRQLSRVLAQSPSPTALLVANPVYYLTTVTYLAQRNLRVPQDISLLSREDDIFLAYLTPEPTRYSFDPKTYAKRVAHLLLAISRGEAVSQAVQRIEPTFVSAASVAAPGRRAV